MLTWRARIRAIKWGLKMVLAGPGQVPASTARFGNIGEPRSPLQRGAQKMQQNGGAPSFAALRCKKKGDKPPLEPMIGKPFLADGCHHLPISYLGSWTITRTIHTAVAMPHFISFLRFLASPLLGWFRRRPWTRASAMWVCQLYCFSSEQCQKTS